MMTIQRATRAPIRWAAMAALLMLAFGTSSATAAVGETTRINVGNEGQQANQPSYNYSVSADGRFVAFDSSASNLVPDDASIGGVFVRDRLAGTTTRASVASDGTVGNKGGSSPAISADGRYVAFVSHSTNLDPDDTNDIQDIYMHDRQTGITARVSLDSAGQQLSYLSAEPVISADGQVVAFMYRPADGIGRVFVKDLQTGELEEASVSSDGTPADRDSEPSAMSADGRYVAFASAARNLVPRDKVGKRDVFVHDRQTGETTRVSVSSQGDPTEHPVHEERVSISADGRYVAFATRGFNLVPNDTNNFSDVFVHDRLTGTTTRVSVDSMGSQAYGSDPALSGDGRFVAFKSRSPDLVPGDTNDYADVFVHDRLTGTTQRVSVASDGAQSNWWSQEPVMSFDGSLVVFRSRANNLVADDTGRWIDIFAHEVARDPVPTITCDRIAEATIVGTAGDDILNGTEGPDVIVGLAGDDTVHGLGGDDLICGDGIINDLPVTASDDTVYGDDGNDQLVGSDGFDVLFGGSGADLLRGNGNADELSGEAGDDTLRGGSGPDELDGGADVDTLDGGPQQDTCVNGETLLSCP